VVGAFTTTSTGFIGGTAIAIIGAVMVIAVRRLFIGVGTPTRYTADMSQPRTPTKRPTRPSTPDRSRGSARPRASNRRTLQITLAAAVLMLVAAALIFVSALTRQNSDSQLNAATGLGLHPSIGQGQRSLVAGRPIAHIQCGAVEGQLVHIHQHLDVVIDGKDYLPPPYVGIIPAKGCLYWIHMHATNNVGDGVIHLEAPVSAAATLGQYLDVWSVSPVDRTLLKKVQGRNPDLVLVNGQAYGGDIRKITLTAHMLISLEYGSKHLAQKPFDFTTYG